MYIHIRIKNKKRKALIKNKNAFRFKKSKLNFVKQK